MPKYVQIIKHHQFYCANTASNSFYPGDWNFSWLAIFVTFDLFSQDWSPITLLIVFREPSRLKFVHVLVHMQLKSHSLQPSIKILSSPQFNHLWNHHNIERLPLAISNFPGSTAADFSPSRVFCQISLCCPSLQSPRAYSYQFLQQVLLLKPETI